jgi:hypothetical protein
LTALDATQQTGTLKITFSTDAITVAHIAPNAIGASEQDAVATVNIADNAVTSAKILKVDAGKSRRERWPSRVRRGDDARGQQTVGRQRDERYPRLPIRTGTPPTRVGIGPPHRETLSVVMALSAVAFLLTAGNR